MLTSCPTGRGCKLSCPNLKPHWSLQITPPPFQFWTFSWEALQRLRCLSKVTVSFLFAAKQWVHVIKQNTHPCRWYRWSCEITCHQTIVTSSIPHKTNLSDYQRISVCKNICKDCILKIALQNKKYSILHPICSWKQCQGNKLHKLDWLHLQYKPDDKLQAKPGKDWHRSCAVMRSCAPYLSAQCNLTTKCQLDISIYCLRKLVLPCSKTLCGKKESRWESKWLCFSAECS